MSTSITARLHGYLHKLPGIPAHSEADRLHRHAHHHRGPHPSPTHSNSHHARPPRVLVGWQNWIAGLFTGRGDHR